MATGEARPRFVVHGLEDALTAVVLNLLFVLLSYTHRRGAPSFCLVFLNVLHSPTYANEVDLGMRPVRLNVPFPM